MYASMIYVRICHYECKIVTSSVNRSDKKVKYIAASRFSTT